MLQRAATALFLGGLAWGQTPATQSAAAKEAKLHVSRSALCTAVRDREPVDALAQDAPASFKAGIGRVIYWTEVNASAPPASVRHVWYAGGKKIGEVKLAVKGARARTWSSQKVWTGEWKVEAVADSGEVLSASQFTVKG